VRIAAVVCLVACGRSEPRVGVTRDATIAVLDAAPPPDAAPPCPVSRPSLGPGLTVERWPIAATPIVGEPCIDVVRADLASHRLRALSDPAGKPAPDWLAAEKLVAVTNAGMFHDGGAPVALVISDSKVRGHDNAKMSGFLAWDPIDPADPPAIVAGKDCPGFDLAALRKRYRSLVQSYRFLSCTGTALPWQDPKHYSAAGIGMDRAGRVVMFHARAAVTMAELATALADHDLAGALFLEGGPEASLVVRGTAGQLDRVGSYETGFVENDDNHAFWALPNIIGLLAR
jgi:hypothetical protein